MPLAPRVSDESFIAAWKSSYNMRETLKKLGMAAAGANYSVARNRARRLGLTKNDHILGVSPAELDRREKIRKNRTYQLSDILVENSSYRDTNLLRKRLISSGTLPGFCQSLLCPFLGMSEIQHPFTGESVPIRLELDHINGVNNDHRIENLRILCAHCHGYTDTYRGKNIKNIK